jgi:putative protease
MIGVVISYDKENKIATIQQRNKVSNGDLVEVLAIKGENNFIRLEDMRNKNGELIESAAHPQMIFTVKCNEELMVKDILVKKK